MKIKIKNVYRKPEDLAKESLAEKIKREVKFKDRKTLKHVLFPEVTIQK